MTEEQYIKKIEGMVNYLTGEVMKLSNGTVDPARMKEMFYEYLWNTIPTLKDNK